MSLGPGASASATAARWVEPNVLPGISAQLRIGEAIMRRAESPTSAAVIAIDPGVTTGWSLFVVRPGAILPLTAGEDGLLELESLTSGILHWTSGQVYGPEEDQARELVRLVDSWPNAVVIVEDFVLRVFRQDRDLLSPVRITAMLEYGLSSCGGPHGYAVSRGYASGWGPSPEFVENYVRSSDARREALKYESQERERGDADISGLIALLSEPVRARDEFRSGAVQAGLDPGVRAIYKQSPADAMRVVTDERLRKWGLYRQQGGQQHARDAVRHAVLALRRARSNPDLARLFWPWLFDLGLQAAPLSEES